MDVPVGEISAAILVKGSRFLGEITPVASPADVRAKLQSRKALYVDASHVVHAFITGQNREFMGMSDDGEPAGTAGRPVLDVLKGRGCTNILLTVTRWFGGTLLGTGGLVHAYGDTARLVLSKAELIPFIPKVSFQYETDYAGYTYLKRSFSEYGISSIHECFTDHVVITGVVPESFSRLFASFVFDGTRGKTTVRFF
jgi:uncharacterized YigZ family protein